MKRFIYFAMLFLLLSCDSKENKIEILQDYDSIYLTDRNVDVPAKEKDSTYSEMFKKDLNNLFKENYDKESGKPMFFNVAFRFYVEENGEIGKIKILEHETFDFLFEDKSVAKYADYNSIYEKLKEILKKYSFTPAIKNGKNVRYRSDFALGCLINPDGSVKNYLPINLSSNLFPFGNEEYLVDISEQPFPIGGVESIMKQIRYPEQAKKEGIQGRVMIKAFLNEKGDVVKTAVLKGIGFGCDEAAENAIKNTKFKPGVLDGKTVKTQVLIPIMFKLQ